MFNNITDLIYSEQQQEILIKNIKDKLVKFNSTKGKSQLHYTKLVQELNSLLELNKEEDDK